MKKTALWFAVVMLSVIVLIGCQETPVFESVGLKNSQNLQQALKSVGPEPQSLDIPTRYEFEKPICNGKGAWRIQAAVSFPDVEAIPVYTAQITPFSDEELTNVMAAFFGPDMVLTSSGDVLSRNAVIEQYLLPAQQTLADIQAGLKVYDNAGEISEAFMQRKIESIQRRVANAPDTDSIIPLSLAGYGTAPDGIYACAGSGNGDCYRVWITNGLNGYPMWMTIVNEYDRYDELAERELVDINLTTTPEEAIQMAEALLDEMAIDYMEVSRISLTGLFGNSEENNQLPENRARQAYAVTFTRTVAGIKSPFDSSYCCNEYYPPYYAERIRVHIDDQGVVAFFWYGHTTLEQLVTPNVPLASFDQVVARAATSMEQVAASILSAPETFGVLDITYNIDSIRLGYAKTINPDGSQSFLMIPVWDFYGTETYTYDEAFIANQNKELGLNNPHIQTYGNPETLMVTINAIDGTIFDRSMGY